MKRRNSYAFELSDHPEYDVEITEEVILCADPLDDSMSSHFQQVMGPMNSALGGFALAVETFKSHGHTVPLLNRSNYGVWKQKMQLLLEMAGQWDFPAKTESKLKQEEEMKKLLTDKQGTPKATREAYQQIVLGVSEDYVPELMDILDGKAAWLFLKEKHEKCGTSGEMR